MLEPPAVPAIDALVGLARGYLNGDNDTRRDPDAQLIVTLDSAVLTGGAGVAAYRSGGSLTSAEVRRLACDAKLATVVIDGPQILDVGRSTRTIPAAIKRALLVRDHGQCQMPGCTQARASRLHAHHIQHWADGGPTSLDNLILLCRAHHKAIHHDGYAIGVRSGVHTFHAPDGCEIPQTPALVHSQPTLPDVDPETIPAWRGEPFNLDYVVSVLLQHRTWRRRQREQLEQAA